jgi:hypothetical protein
MAPINRRERCDGSGFRIEKTTPKCRLPPVLRALANLCRHLPLGFGRRRGAAQTRRSARLASFMAQHNRPRLDTDLRDAALQGRRLVKNLLRVALLAGGAWVVVESAKALSVF